MLESSKYIISILSWDTPEYIDNLLLSLEAFTPSIDTFKVIVLDQGSDSETLEVLNNHSDNIILLKEPDNIGFSKGHNRVSKYAIENYKFDFFCCVNSDMIIMESGWLDKLSVPFQNDKNMGITGPFALNLNWMGVGFESKEKNDFDIISGALFLTSKNNILEYGLFDEIFTPAYYEDTDLNMRYKKAGLRLQKVSIDCSHHYLYKTEKSSILKNDVLRNEYKNFQYRNSVIFLRRWLGKGFYRKGMGNKITGYTKFILFVIKDGKRKMRIYLKAQLVKVL